MDNILRVLVPILSLIVKNLSPSVREAIANGIKAWLVEANKTENPFDNLAVAVAAAIFDVSI